MKRKDKRTTVSLAPVLWVMAEAQMERKGFNNNFSSYVADLIRRDHERYAMTADELAARLAPYAAAEPAKAAPAQPKRKAA